MSISWDEALDRVRQVVVACVESDAQRLRVEEKDFSVEVRRTPRRPASPSVSQAQAAFAEADGMLVAPSSNGVASPKDEPTLLTADFVGILRFSRPVAVEGSTVDEERELAYVESLGTRNPVRAARRGKIVAVHVIDGQPVDYGHPLFAVAYE